MEPSRRPFGGVERVPVESRVWMLTKFSLNAFLLLVSLCGIVMGFCFIRFPKEQYVVMLIAGSCCVFGTAFVCSGAEFLHRLIKKQSIAPPILIALYLLVAVPCPLYGGWVAWFVWAYDNYAWYYDMPPDIDLSGSPANDLALAAVSLLVTSFVVSLVLFVGACFDTNAREKYRAARRMAENPETWTHDALEQGWQPPPTYYFQDNRSDHAGEMVCDDEELEEVKKEKCPSQPKMAYSS